MYSLSKIMKVFWKYFYCHSLLLFIIFKSQSCESAKILAIFPLPFSHIACDNAVIRSLKDAGHEITVITSFPPKVESENYTKVIDASIDTLKIVGQASFNAFRKMSVGKVIDWSISFEEPFCDRVFNLKEYQDAINSKDKLFDVVFVEIFYLYKCHLPVAQKLGVPVIAITTFNSWYLADRAVSNVRHPANVPHEWAVEWKFHKFYERFVNTWYNIVTEYKWYSRVVPFVEEFYQRYEDQLRSYTGFLDIEPVLIFYNTHHSILPRPMNPNVVEIGGIQIQPAKSLPKKIEKFIQEAQHGVILFSLGSVVNASTLSSDVTKTFTNAFARIPQRVIWKYEGQIENLPSNVMTMKWVPQRDILEHPNVKAFISHCGQAGLYETIYTASPVIACPLMFDQPANAEILENLGAAVQLDIDSVSEESIISAINSIFNDTSYYDNMQKLSKVFKDRPMTPQQTVVYWTEYILRHKGNSNMKTPSSRLNWFQYFLLDIFCIILIMLAFIIYFICWCFKTIILFKAKVQRCWSCGKNKLE